MGFLYPHHPRDRLHSSTTSPRDDHKIRLPDRPSPVARPDSYSSKKSDWTPSREIDEDYPDSAYPSPTQGSQPRYSRQYERTSSASRQEQRHEEARPKQQTRARSKSSPREGDRSSVSVFATSASRNDGPSNAYIQRPLRSKVKHRRDAELGTEGRKKRELDPERAARKEARRIRRAEREARRRAEVEQTNMNSELPNDQHKDRSPYSRFSQATHDAPSTPNTEMDHDCDQGLGNGQHEYQRYARAPLIGDEFAYSPQDGHTRMNEKHFWHEHDSEVDLESSFASKREPHSQRSSAYDELSWYKRTTMPDPYARHYEDGGYCCCCCGVGGGANPQRRRIFCIVAVVVTIAALIAIIAAAVTVAQSKYNYPISYAQVNNTAAFATGGATNISVNATTPDGLATANDAYTYYSGNASAFPPSTQWISFEALWTANLPVLQQSCGWLHAGADDTPSEIAALYAAIQNRANASLVDHRFILAVVLQESHGCVRIHATTSATGVRNPGLMQSHAGVGFDARHPAASIMAMIQDGTQGTLERGPQGGPGLVQALNEVGDPYSAARVYNSGYIPVSGNLSEAAGATACYVSDVANRLTGWVMAPSTCGESD